MKKIFTTLIIILTITFLTSSCVFREFGKNPSKKEVLEYEKLSYFKDSEFQSPQKMVYNFENVRNGPVSRTRFLTKSKFAPTIELETIKLNKNSFQKEINDFAIYWLGHSSAIMEIQGKRIAFDPVIGNAAPAPFIVPRFGKSPIKRKDLPDFDYVVITHNHYDHLERKTVKSIKNAKFIVPLGVGSTLKGWGIKENRIIELGWEESFEDGDFKIVAEKGVHYTSRSPWNKNKTLWNSYSIFTKDKSIFWGGDTGYSDHFIEIGEKYNGFDLVVLEIDGWNPGWQNTHLFPDEVIKTTQDLGAKKLLPIHWGVFDLALHPWHESIDMLLEEVKDTDISILTPKMGEKIDLNSTTTQWWL